MAEGRTHTSSSGIQKSSFYCVNFFVGNPEGKLLSFGSGNILLFGWEVVHGTEQHRRVRRNRARVFLLNIDVKWVLKISSVSKTFLPAVKRSL